MGTGGLTDGGGRGNEWYTARAGSVTVVCEPARCWLGGPCPMITRLAQSKVRGSQVPLNPCRRAGRCRHRPQDCRTAAAAVRRAGRCTAGGCSGGGGDGRGRQEGECWGRHDSKAGGTAAGGSRLCISGLWRREGTGVWSCAQKSSCCCTVCMGGAAAGGWWLCITGTWPRMDRLAEVCMARAAGWSLLLGCLRTGKRRKHVFPSVPPTCVVVAYAFINKYLTVCV